MRFRLRTLLIVSALGPPMLAWMWIEYAKYRTPQQQREALRRQFLVPAGSGARVLVPAANSTSGDPNDERVFSFHVGFNR